MASIIRLGCWLGPQWNFVCPHIPTTRLCHTFVSMCEELLQPERPYLCNLGNFLQHFLNSLITGLCNRQPSTPLWIWIASWVDRWFNNLCVNHVPHHHLNLYCSLCVAWGICLDPNWLWLVCKPYQLERWAFHWQRQHLLLHCVFC